MNQTLKIAIARGGCRFASPLYLGCEYNISFSGDRSDEADSILITKPRSTDSRRKDSVEGLAVSIKKGGSVTLGLNTKLLVDWFERCEACDIDNYVDCHCFVFDSNGSVIADSGITIEFRPIDFAISNSDLATWRVLDERISTLSSSVSNHDTRIGRAETGLSDANDKIEEYFNDAIKKIEDAKNDAIRASRDYADSIKRIMATIQYVKCDDESTDGIERFHRILVVHNEDGEPVLALSPDLYNSEGGEVGTTNYCYLDSEQDITGQKTFKSIPLIDANYSGAGNYSVLNIAEFTKRINNILKNYVKSDSLKLDGYGSISGDNTWTGINTFETIEVNDTIYADVYGTITVPLADRADFYGACFLRGSTIAHGTVSFKKPVTFDSESSETHNGIEEHFGTEYHHGEVNIKTSDFSDDVNSEYTTEIVNKKYAWDMMRYFCEYFDGYWRICIGGYSANEKGSISSYTAWQTQDGQGGIFLPDSSRITSFKKHTNLYKVHAPSVSVVFIAAFQGCTKLTEVKIPKCIDIQNLAFDGCSSLRDLYLYGMDYNTLMSNISKWSLNTSATVHATRIKDDGTTEKCLIKYSNSSWQYAGPEDDGGGAGGMS